MEDSIPAAAGLNHLVFVKIPFYFILRKLSLCERRLHIFLGRRGRGNLRRLGILCILRIYLPISAFTCLLLRSLGNFDKELVQGKVVADGVLKYSHLYYIYCNFSIGIMVLGYLRKTLYRYRQDIL